MSIPDAMREELATLTDDLAERYRDLHAHPELSMQERRTAKLVADQLRAAGYDVTEAVGTTGVIGVLRNGDGPVVLLRADMDALPVKEDTGLDYASTETGVDAGGNEHPVMHACGHDAHVTCLLAASRLLSGHRDTWHGTVLATFQPAEETGAGALAMLDDGMLDRFPRPDVCLGQHVMPLTAGHVALRPGATMAASDSLRVRLFGRGGHGSMPQTAVDPVVLAASTVLRLQTVVSREVSASDTAVLTVGSLQAGNKENIIPDDAELKLNIRSYDEDVRSDVLAAVERIVSSEAQASAAPRSPEISELSRFPVTANDPDATETVRAALSGELGDDHVHDMLPIPGSEDFGRFGTAAGVPSVFWFYGGLDPANAQEQAAAFATGRLPAGVASNHSPKFAPVIEPTLETGARALLAAALAWLRN
jgi:hippurate hydrolase